MTLDSGSDQPTNNLGGGRGLFRAIRWVIVIILLALGFVLIQRGQYLFGWIIVGLAVLRVVLIFASGRRQAFGYRGSGSLSGNCSGGLPAMNSMWRPSRSG